MISSTLYKILIGLSLVTGGCDAWSQVRPTPPAATSEVARLALTPDELVLNVPSGDPCPCPYDSTGSFHVAGGPAAAWRVADAGVAAVGSDGLVSAVAVGTTLVAIEAGSQRATASIRVVDRGGRAAVVVQ